ncbi:hypothetical protein [Desulfonema magnum]|uniref:hypothetical protein n=1 Tax=Desulfonema magnum TaxID=45655 RepID=UPI001A9BDF0B|nr:hypothetical protein [Desulfonema magnum]
MKKIPVCTDVRRGQDAKHSLCIPTQSVGTRKRENEKKSGMHGRQARSGREASVLHSHAKRGNEKRERPARFRKPRRSYVRFIPENLCPVSYNTPFGMEPTFSPPRT